MQLPTSTDERRAAAVRAFWSDDPLNLSFREKVGPTFSLKAFVAFVVDMPADQFEACTAKQREGVR
ncbi:hypothetical protein LJR220_003366 [Bradyrhizobium sp. LjRoot220]|uniref:hypothetical protein n=1 Tax=Bradyrhizobium sp. LjRoot220 TaxID=3342284 RepID=UPI003ECF25EA